MAPHVSVFPLFAARCLLIAPMRTFILAGGFATRLWPLTEQRAKPLLPIAGEPLLTHLVEKLPEGMAVTVSTNAAFEEGFVAWKETMGARDITLVIEGTRSDDQKLGALGALAAWIQAEHINDDILVLTGDNFLGFSMHRFLAQFQGDPLLAAHDIGDLAKAAAFGTVITDSEDPTRIQAFEEKPKDPKTTLVSAGCIVLPRATLPIVLEFAKTHPDNVGGIFEELLRRGLTVRCFTFKDPWIDIGSFGSYLDAHRLLVGNETMIGQASTDTDCTFEGSVAIGKDCRLERSDIKDCMIFDGCVVTDCTLRNCIVDEGCVLTGVDLQNQMLRTGTRLEVPN